MDACKSSDLVVTQEDKRERERREERKSIVGYANNRADCALMDNTLPTAHILVQVLCGIVKSVKDENIQIDYAIVVAILLFRCQAHRPPPLRAVELVACLLSALSSCLSTRLPDLHRIERGRAGVERKRGKATTGRGAATLSSSPPPLFLAPGERNVEHRRGFLPTATPVAAHFLRLSAAASLPFAGRERRKERERRDGKSSLKSPLKKCDFLWNEGCKRCWFWNPAPMTEVICAAFVDA
uniref:Uncharacterized protein n=1 Tax=Oryza nivara TaxID=4536 RepID=A0A0E0G3R0_ORYNI